MTAVVEQVLWLYLLRATTAHALPVGGGRSAVCGMSPAWWKPDLVWLGAVDVAEQEHAARLPRCARCVRILAGRDSKRRAAEARREQRVRPDYFTAEVAEFYDWMLANGVDEWLPENPQLYVGNGQLTYTSYRWEGERGWDVDAVCMPEFDGEPLTEVRTVPLRSGVTPRLRELSRTLPFQLFERDAR